MPSSRIIRNQAVPQFSGSFGPTINNQTARATGVALHATVTDYHTSKECSRGIRGAAHAARLQPDAPRPVMTEYYDFEARICVAATRRPWSRTALARAHGRRFSGRSRLMRFYWRSCRFGRSGHRLAGTRPPLRHHGIIFQIVSVLPMGAGPDLYRLAWHLIAANPVQTFHNSIRITTRRPR